MTRNDAKVMCRVAGYHADQALFVRTYTENRIGYDSAKREYQRGAAMKKAGTPCTCIDCKREAIQKGEAQ